MFRNIRTTMMLFVFSSGFGSLTAQQFNPHYNAGINSHCNGYYVYLPLGYNPAGTEKYPLLIALHGVGERGDGSNSASGLPLLVAPDKGIASLIYAGGFPASFTVGGNTYRFIVICPQFTNNGSTWPDASDLSAVFNYAVANYKADLNRVYLAGLSMGAGIIFNYVTTSVQNASQVAAMVPVCAALQPGPPYAAKPDSTACRTITASNLPIWATHNSGDITVPSSFTDSLVHYVDAAPAPTPLARKTIFTTWIYDHDAWTKTFDPSYAGFDGMNIYQWMLQYQRFISPLPVALINYKAIRSGKTAVTVSWQTENEKDNDHFTIERSSNGKDFSLLSQVKGLNKGSNYNYVDEHPLKDNYYRLSQTDKDGKTVYYSVLKVVLNGIVENLSIYPTLVKDVLKISGYTTETGLLGIAVYSTDGRLVKKWSFNYAGSVLDKNIPVSDLSKGVYFLHINGSATHTVKMFMKE